MSYKQYPVPWTTAEHYNGVAEDTELKILGDHIYFGNEPVARMLPGLFPSFRERAEFALTSGDIPPSFKAIDGGNHHLLAAGFVNVDDMVKFLTLKIETYMKEDGCHGLASAQEISDMIRKALENG